VIASVATDDPWILFACRSAYSAEVAEIIWRRGEQVEAMVDNMGEPVLLQSDIAKVISVDEAAHLIRANRCAVPLITPGFRFSAVLELRSLGATRFGSIIDPTSVIARSTSIGSGSIVNALSVVGANSLLGEFVHVNRSASIGHDAHIEDFTTIGPGSILAGHVTVRSGAFVGAGAICSPGITIGANSVVGAGAVITRDVPDLAVVVGNPARVMRSGEFGHGHASVPTS
jgi:sugar O-acyltransferase (sialic acid O-acetyltransferase NeuD family)